MTKKKVKSKTKRAAKTKVKANARSKTKSRKVKTTKKSVSKAKKLSIGDVVPDFTAPATGGKTVKLSELRNKKVVLFFYPKDMTPGCTIEGHEFTKLKSNFDSLNTIVYGISRDTVTSHEKFKEKECYTIDLLSDVDEKICKLFDVIKDKNMYGKIVKGIERSTFVIDEEGKLSMEWRGVKVEGHAQIVLEQLSSRPN